MPRRPTPLPSCLADAFTIQQALSVGMTRKQLQRLPAPFRGVRCRREPETLAQRARAALLALPDGTAIAGATAAHLLELWLPRSWDPDDPIEVVVPIHRTPPRMHGIRGWREDATVVDVDGIPVCSPADVFAQLARRLALPDLVVLGDSVVQWRSGRHKGDLLDALHPGRHGRPRAIRALRHVREGSASAPESMTRLVLLDAGLPEPELNGEVVLRDRVVYLDLLWRDARAGVEYHGAHHFETPEQRRADFDRLADVRREGWTVVELGRGVLGSSTRREAFVADVARALGVTPRPPRFRGRLLGRPRKRRRRR